VAVSPARMKESCGRSSRIPPHGSRREVNVVAGSRCYLLGRGQYPSHPPYSPSEPYPEYFQCSALGKENELRLSRRSRALQLLGLDREHFGTASWNPFAGLVRRAKRWFSNPFHPGLP
jgi:hypothetical protein